jgi:DNA-directed RNA polymerase specialized sigma24 family protein
MTETEKERRRRFDSLFRGNVAGIASYCGWRSRSPGEEQDAVAEVFLIAWRRLDAVPEGEDARPWLYATARRVLANQARANVRRNRLNEKLSAQPVDVKAEEDPLARQVHEALAALGQRDREGAASGRVGGTRPGRDRQSDALPVGQGTVFVPLSSCKR